MGFKYFIVGLLLTFVTTLNVAFFSSVSELVTVTRSSSALGVVGLKQQQQETWKLIWTNSSIFITVPFNNMQTTTLESKPQLMFVFYTAVNYNYDSKQWTPTNKNWQRGSVFPSQKKEPRRLFCAYWLIASNAPCHRVCKSVSKCK